MDVVERVKPAVVGVRAQLGDETVGRSSRRSREQEESSPDQFGAPSGRPGAPPTPGRRASIGSGFFISSDGYIVTTNHVTRNAERIAVTLLDGRRFEATVVGGDADMDVSIARISARNLTAVPFGGAGFSHARFSDGSASNGVDVSGNRLANAPSYTANFGVQYGRPLRNGLFSDPMSTTIPCGRRPASSASTSPATFIGVATMIRS